MRINTLQAMILLSSISCNTFADDVMNRHHAHHLQEIAKRGSQVMPFALEKTLHQFTPTANGGVQRVIARDSQDSEQIALIQQHLLDMTKKFSQRDFSGPGYIHGANMPGLQTLAAASANQLQIDYTSEKNGASIQYSSQDAEIVTAIHQWFAAQLHDHGADAEPGR